MRSLILFLAFIAFTTFSFSQIRIDSSFAFGTNPAKKYSLYIPQNYNPATANQMMVGFHPFNTSRWDSESWCDTLLAFSEMNDLILVCPDGDADGNITDPIDYAFTTVLIDSVKKWYNIDSNRIYAIGFSFGGKAVYEYGLNNAETFGGFIPIGAAVSGASFLNNIIDNAGLRPFYLVHGNNDSPSARYFPLLAALNNNCAIVNSILMSGVGHTIDFPNRNAILTDAYMWIDSVNLTPRSASFSLVAPPNLSSLTIKGFNEYLQYFIWNNSPLADTCGVLKYEVMFDLPSGNFSSPLLTLTSDKEGSDTILSLTNHIIDSLLGAFSVPINSTLTLDWTVKSNILNKFSDTAKSFQITFVRKKLGFNLTSPTNNNVVTLQNNSYKFFNWEDLNHYISVDYLLLFDDTSGDFSNPRLSYESSAGGSSSSLNINHETLYYDLMFLDGIKIGDTTIVNWRAIASDSVFSEFSLNERTITFIRGNVGFQLFQPVDNSLITSKKGTDYIFSWDSVLLDNIKYEWRFDTLGVDLRATASYFLGSDVDSTHSRISITYEILDSIMNIYNVNYLDTLHGQWTSRAVYDGGEEYSLTTFNVSIVRAHPIGISEHSNNSEISLFPIPATNQVTMTFIAERKWEVIQIYDIRSSLVFEEKIKSGENFIIIETSEFSEGTYIWNLIREDVLESGKFIIIK